MKKSDKPTKTKIKKISLSDVMKTDSSKIIQKLESQIPLNFQESSLLYTSYLHTIDNIFGTFCVAEREFFDKLNIDQEHFLAFQKFSNFFANICLQQIDIYSKFRHANIQFQMSLLESYDGFFKSMIDSYAKFLPQFNQFIDPKNK